MQCNENNYEGAEREREKERERERERGRKNNKQIAKKNFVRGHSYMTSTKYLKNAPLPK